MKVEIQTNVRRPFSNENCISYSMEIGDKWVYAYVNQNIFEKTPKETISKLYDFCLKEIMGGV